jgi:hypothetical protein
MLIQRGTVYYLPMIISMTYDFKCQNVMSDTLGSHVLIHY